MKLNKYINVILIALLLNGCVTGLAEGPSLKDGAAMAAIAKTSITEISVSDVKPKLSYSLVIDVREPNEYADGAVPNAISIPRGVLEFKIGSAVSEYAKPKDLLPVNTPIVLYCSSGNRGALAADTLQRMGYKNVVSILGGYKAWTKQ